MFEHRRTIATVDLGRIGKNLHFLLSRALSTHGELRGAVPMIKCNAYGHGLVEVARFLEKRKGVVGLGVATVEEGILLRNAGVRKTPIWVFTDCTPLHEELAIALQRFSLTPVLHRLADLQQWVQPSFRRFRRSVPLHLKFNTGMNRLGIGFDQATDLQRCLSILRGEGLPPQGYCTHMASSDRPKSAITRIQLKQWAEWMCLLNPEPTALIHGANTDAIVADSELKLGRSCNVIRPGLGLYGYDSIQTKFLKPALVWDARLLEQRRLGKGERVGYGATFSVGHKNTANRAGLSEQVLAIGYGDGLKRALSNKTISVEELGRRKRQLLLHILGRVSMDSLATACTENKDPAFSRTQAPFGPETWFRLLGCSQSQGHALAESSGTVIYEILTSISMRVSRRYVGDRT